LWGALYALPPAVLVWAFCLLRVHVPVAEQIDLVPIINRTLSQRALDVPFLFAQWNESRIVTTKLVILMMILLRGSWSPEVEQFCPLVFAAINVILLWRLGIRSMKDRAAGDAKLLQLLACVLVFSLTQWFSWSDPITMHFHICSGCFLGAVLLLSGERLSGPRLLGAAALCLMATYSYANGLSSWFAVSPLIYLRRTNRRVWKVLSGIWSAVTGATLWCYFHHYDQPTYHPSIWIAAYHPADALSFFFKFLAGPLCPTVPLLAFVVGEALVVSIIFVLSESSLRALAFSDAARPWLCVLLFVLASAAMTAVGRVGYGSDAGMHSRFLVTGLLGWIACAYLAYLCCPEQRKLLKVMLICICLSQAYFDLVSWDSWRAQSAQFKEGQACLETYQISSPACLSKLMYGIVDGERIRFLAPTLENLGTFKPFTLPGDVSYVSPSDFQYGSFDGMSGRQAFGWALLNGRPASEIILTNAPGRHMIGHATAVLEREDIASWRGERARYCGWNLELDNRMIGKRGQRSRIEAWIFDRARHLMIQLPASKAS